MALGDLVRQVGHGAMGVPRLYVAALRTGLGPAESLQVLRISEAVLRTAGVRGRGAPGRVNALRHFMWQALLTARFGRAVAQSIAAAQETGSPHPKDSEVDRHNNAVGQAWGDAHASELRSTSLSRALASLAPVGLEKWDSGELIWVRKR